jgi:NAD(P)H dehydrogenase (quinone)
MKIGISGASGQLGTATVAELKSRAPNAQLVGISRTPDSSSTLTEARFGDYNRPESLASAYVGLDRLLIIPTADLTPGRRRVQNTAAVDAAVAAGVGHVCFVSAAGTRAAEESDLLESYFATEQHLMKTAPRWSILRMNFYAETFVQQAQMSLAGGVLAELGEGRVALVSRDDLAAAAAGLLTSDGHDGAIYNITGPESLSGAERAAKVATATGKPFQFVSTSEDVLRSQWNQAGLPAEVIPVFVSMLSHFKRGDFDIVTGDVEHLSGKPPRPFAEVLARVLAGG